MEGKEVREGSGGELREGGGEVEGGEEVVEK